MARDTNLLLNHASDLSFNNISVIEGLEGLTKLTDLSLYNNRISKLENMDSLVNLNVFSIGNNNLTDLENVRYLFDGQSHANGFQLSYLRRFDNLRILNVAGNPLCSNADYKYYILAHMRELKYLDYRLAEEDEVGQMHAF